MINLIFLLIYFAVSKFIAGSDLYILLTVHFSILIIIYLRDKKLSITPLLIYYLGVIIVNIANISIVSQVEGARKIKIYSYIIPKFIDDAALIWCISSTIFVIGYNLYINTSFPSIAVDLKNKKYISRLFYFILFITIFNYIGSGIGRNQIGKIIGLLNSIGILFFARLWAKEDNKTYRLYAISLYILETYIALVSSFLRNELIIPTFYLFIGYFIGKGDLKYVFSYRIIPLLVIILIYSSVFAALENNRFNFINVFTQKDKNVGRERAENPEGNEAGGLLDRSSNVAQMTNIVNLVQRNGLYEGKASAPLVTALIPRFLWPDKPQIQLGAWFALEIGAAYKNESGYINNSINMTMAGELFLDFGWLGVVIGSFLFGGFIAVLWNSTKFYDSEYNITGVIFGGYLILLSIGSYADLQIVITLISTYLIFFVIKKIADVL